MFEPAPPISDPGRRRRATITIWIALALLGGQQLARSQDPPQKREPTIALVGRVARAIRELRERDELEVAESVNLQLLESGLKTAIERIENLDAASTSEQYFVDVSHALLTSEFGDESVRVAAAGIKLWPRSRRLLDHLGMGYMLQSISAESPAARRAMVRQALAALRRAEQIEPETFHTFLVLFQALEAAQDFEAALAALEQGLTWAEARKSLGARVHYWKGKILLGMGCAKEAAAALAQVPDDEVDEEDQILRLRALAMSGDAAPAMAAAAKLRGTEPSDYALVAVADVYLFLGKGKEAEDLLVAIEKMERDRDEDHTRQLAKSLACLRLLGVAGKGDDKALRVALTKALDHHVFVMEGADKKVDLSGSPAAMAWLLLKREYSLASWAEQTLFALCVLEAAKDPKAAAGKGKGEQLLLQTLDDAARVSIFGPDAAAAAMRMLRGSPSEWTFCGALAARRVAQRLESKPAR